MEDVIRFMEYWMDQIKGPPEAYTTFSVSARGHAQKTESVVFEAYCDAAGAGHVFGCETPQEAAMTINKKLHYDSSELEMKALRSTAKNMLKRADELESAIMERRGN